MRMAAPPARIVQGASPDGAEKYHPPSKSRSDRPHRTDVLKLPLVSGSPVRENAKAPAWFERERASPPFTHDKFMTFRASPGFKSPSASRSKATTT